MTFEHTARATTTATPAQVWALWSDTTTWPDWDPAVEGVVLDADFVAGAGGTMALRGGIEAPLLLEVVEAVGEDPAGGRARYCDRLTLGELRVTIDHVVTATAMGSEIEVRTTLEGPGADDVGPLVTADAPVALAALTARAEGRA